MSDTKLQRPINISFCTFSSRFMDVRVSQPNMLMETYGARIKLSDNAVKAPTRFPEEEPKILILQRMLAKEGQWQDAMRQIMARGWLTVSEIDDYPADTGLQSNNSKWAGSMGWRGYACCHAVQTSSNALAEILREYNPEVAVFENQLFCLPEFAQRGDNKVRVFFGALNRQEDWAPLMSMFNEVAKKHTDVEFVVIQDKEFFDALETENKKFRGIVDYQTYLSTMASCDIALMPLRDKKFTRCKSDIKFLEAAGAGVAVVASPTVYADSVRDGETGFIAETADDWREALTKLIKDAELRKRIGAQAQSYVLSERMLSKHIHKRIDWYRSLWDRREELNAALIDRFPELAP